MAQPVIQNVKQRVKVGSRSEIEAGSNVPPGAVQFRLFAVAVPPVVFVELILWQPPPQEVLFDLVAQRANDVLRYGKLVLGCNSVFKRNHKLAKQLGQIVKLLRVFVKLHFVEIVQNVVLDRIVDIGDLRDVESVLHLEVIFELVPSFVEKSETLVL